MEGKVKTYLMLFVDYMADNKLAPNKKKTQFIVFTSERMRPIKVGDCSIQEDNCVTFLGAVINKKLDWTDHVRRDPGRIVHYPPP
jgi:hypothetical protein